MYENTAYIRSYTAYIQYMVYGNPMYGSGQPYIYGVNTVFLAGKSPNIRSYTVYIYGSGPNYIHTIYSIH